jgi:oligoendopeptidase F
MKTRSEISNDYKWDLTKIFETDSDFDKFYDETKKLIVDYKKYEGHIMDDAKTFYNSTIDSLEISRRLEKLYTYAHMKSDEDVSLNSNQELVSRVINLYNLASQAMYFEGTELLKEDYSKIEEFYKEEPRLLEHEINIKNSFRYKNHILSDAEEKIMSNLNGAFDNNETTYSYLTNSDMTFGTIKDESGNEVELTDTNYSIFIESKDRRVRIDAFKTLYKYYKQFTNTITSTLNGNIKESVAVSHIRKYNSAFERSLFNDEMDPKVFKTLVDTVHENLDIYQKYYDLKKEVLGLDEIHLYDVYAKLINDYDKTYSFDEAKELVFKALSVMGEEYTNDLEKAFSQKWIDIYPNKNKRGGAYSSGSYDTYQYVLLNYQGRLNDV